MKITCFICSMGSGGAEHQMSILTTMLVEKGYDVELVTFSGDGYHYPISEQVKRIRIAKTNNKILKFSSIFWFFLTHETDCIISFGQRENLLSIIPLIFRPHIKIIAGERNYTIGRSSAIENVLFRYLYRFVDFIVPNSYSQGAHIVSRYSRYKRKIFTITNYTDLVQYKHSDLPDNIILKVGVFCRYNAQKNYERFAIVIKRLKECGYNLIIDWYGNRRTNDNLDNPEYIKFKKIVDDMGISDILRLNDHVKDVSILMPQFDAICVPSLHEGWSNTISEGICCGRPMLVSDVSDNGRMVISGENGFLFNPLDVDDMYDAFVRFLSTSKKERTIMGANSRNIAEQLFDANKFINNYTNLIESKNV